MTANAPSDRRRLGDLAPKLFVLGLVVGFGGLIVSVIIALLADHGWERFFRTYLTAFMWGLSLCLGGLFWVAIQHVTRAGWSVAIRRIAEGVMSNLRWYWILFIPIAIGMWLSDKTHLYHWASSHDDPVLTAKSIYLNKEFWLIRAVIFFAVWGIFATLFCRTSVAQDRTGEASLTSRMQWFAPLALITYAFTQTFASIDWIKSLEAHWFSTMFGVYFFAASTCGFFSLLILMVYFLQRRHRLTNEITREHYQDMGKQLFAFGVVFWAYIAFSQYMLIWYANLPEETTWYLARQVGPWLKVSVFLLVGHFIAPFLLLLSKHPKRIKGFLVAIAGWMLFMHYIDIYWVVMPKVPEEITNAASYAEIAEQARLGLLDLGYGWHVIDLTCLLAIAGLLLAGTTRWLARQDLIPTHDPRLHESLAFENI